MTVPNWRRDLIQTCPFEELSKTTQVIIDDLSAKPRMKLLNVLRAAPGQHNRALVADFLVFKKWIKPGQEPEQWPVRYMPQLKQMGALVEDLAKFEQMRREQANPEIVP